MSLIETEEEHGMIEPIWRIYRTFYETINMQTGFLVFARVSNMDDGMAHGDLKYLEMYG